MREFIETFIIAFLIFMSGLGLLTYVLWRWFSRMADRAGRGE